MELRDKLTGALIGLVRAVDGNDHLLTENTPRIVLAALKATLEAADSNQLQHHLDAVTEEKRRIVPDCFLCACPCGRTADFDMNDLKTAPADIREVKEAILLALREAAAACACLGAEDAMTVYRALFAIGMEDFDREDLMMVLAEVQQCRSRMAQ